MDGGEDAVEEITRDCDLGELEGDPAGVAHDAGADLDQPRLQARQGPGGDLVGQVRIPTKPDTESDRSRTVIRAIADSNPTKPDSDPSDCGQQSDEAGQ